MTLNLVSMTIGVKHNVGEILRGGKLQLKKQVLVSFYLRNSLVSYFPGSRHETSVYKGIASFSTYCRLVPSIIPKNRIR